jgi:hypothetical protein
VLRACKFLPPEYQWDGEIIDVLVHGSDGYFHGLFLSFEEEIGAIIHRAYVEDKQGNTFMVNPLFVRFVNNFNDELIYRMQQKGLTLADAKEILTL